MQKFVLLLLATLLVAATSFMTFLIVEKLSARRLARENFVNLRNFTLFDLDSARFDSTSDRNTVLMYFDSECSYCQHGLSELFSNQILFENSNIVLMSSEGIRSIKTFVQRTYPVQSSNVHFTKINTDEAIRMLGSLVVPQTFIYASDGSLIKTFKGETKIGAILKYL